MEQTSIQNFYSKETASNGDKTSPKARNEATLGDGFTSTEVQSYLQPEGLGPWHPQHEYNETDIGSVQAGSGRVMLTGRILNYHKSETKGAMHPKPNGYFRFFLKDDAGIISVKLWYAKVTFNIHIDQLVSIWTVHVNVSDPNSGCLTNRFLHVNLYPEGDRTSYFMSYQNSDDGTQCKQPLDYRPRKPLAGLMTLKNFIEGGYEVNDCKIMLCVKSVGQRKKVTIKRGTPRERDLDKLDVVLFDDTSSTILSLWDHLCSSALHWKPSNTILLFTNPTYREDRTGQIGLDYNSFVEVDPVLEDANWLREYAASKSRREHVNPPFPEGLFDIEAALGSEQRVLFRLADIDEWVRAAPEEYFVGYFSLVITELNLAKLHQRSMLCSGECCNIPVYANTLQGKCRHCDKDLTLRLNPRIIGPLLDETGNIAAGKLICSDEAWTQLFGRSAANLVAETPASLKALEHRMLFLRVTWVMGWSPSIGRLVVLKISA